MSQKSATDNDDSDLEAIGSDELGTLIQPVDLSRTWTDSQDTTTPGSSDSGSYRLVENVSKNAFLAVENLYNIGSDTENLLQDKKAAEELEAYFTDILLFCEAEITGQLHGREDREYMRCIVSVFDVAFLHILPNIRRKLLQIASIIDGYCSGDTVVCSVDLFLACFPDFVSSIAGNRLSGGKQIANLPSGISHQRQEDGLRLACQLPHSWQHYPALLQSAHTSPASKRLALSILFAALVIRSDLEACDPWEEIDIKPEYVLECLQPLLEEFLSQARNLALSENNPANRPLRTAYAMAVALFSSAEAAIQRREGPTSPPFQPYTAASLLEVIQLILLPSSTPTAWDELDDAQSILLCWGNTVPWSWEKWDDPRIVGFETVVMLTSVWLYHVDKSLSISFWDKPNVLDDGTVLSLSTSLVHALREAMKINPRASLVALFYQIRDEPSRSVESEAENNFNILRLYRASFCLAELIEICGKGLDSDDLSHVVEQLVLFFVELNETMGEAGSRVKEEIVRCLNALVSDITEKVFLSFHKNVSFFTKIAGVIAKASRMITKDPTGRFLLGPGIPLGLATLLDLISLFYKHNAGKCLPVTTFSFLADLLKFLSSYVGTPAMRLALLNCLVHAHGHCQTSRPGVSNAGTESNRNSPAAQPHKTWDDEDAYNLALNATGTNSGLAAAFASYVSVTIKKSTDVLLVAETWNYLCDVLLILATGRLEDCDGTLVDTDTGLGWVAETQVSVSESKALKFTIMTEKICIALETLLKRSDVGVARILLDSPLAISLHDSLDNLTKITETGTLEGDVGSEAEYRTDEVTQLDPRVVKTCKKFLEKLKKIKSDLDKGGKVSTLLRGYYKDKNSTILAR